MTFEMKGPERARPGRLRVGVISAGRVGSVLGSALERAGHQVIAASAASEASRARAAHWLPDAVLLSADRVVAESELVLLAVPDDTLGPLVRELAGAGLWRPGHLVVHTSGSHGLDVLASVSEVGAGVAALHPALSLTARPEDSQRLAGARFGVTAPPRLRPVAEALVLEMGGEPVWVPDESRTTYHAALTLGANHLVTLVNDAVELLRDAGVEDPSGILGPLLVGALENSLRLGDGALTGPVSRGDASTVARHLDDLIRRRPEMVQAYDAMARRTAARAVAAGRLRPEAGARVLDALARVGGSHV